MLFWKRERKKSKTEFSAIEIEMLYIEVWPFWFHLKVILKNIMTHFYTILWPITYQKGRVNNQSQLNYKLNQFIIN